MNKMKKIKISFTKYEKICPDHIATNDRLCYCGLTSEEGNRINLCNKANCPKFGKSLE
jgi:hypothetical protein